jgi:hypothetical protein
MQSEAVAMTLRVTQILDALHIPYAIGSSMASTAHGRIRTTYGCGHFHYQRPAF